MRMLSVNDICDQRNISRTQFYRLLKAGTIPAGELVGMRHRRWRPEVVEAAFAALNQSAA